MVIDVPGVRERHPLLRAVVPYGLDPLLLSVVIAASVGTGSAHWCGVCPVHAVCMPLCMPLVCPMLPHVEEMCS